MKLWRLHGAKVMVFIQCIALSFQFYPLLINGIIMLLMLTVPCGMPFINKNKFFWYSRQLAFLLMAVINLYLSIQ